MPPRRRGAAAALVLALAGAVLAPAPLRLDADGSGRTLPPSVRFHDGSVELAGQFLAPARAEPEGCVILLPGSGPVRAGDAGPGRGLYRQLEAAFLAAGLIVFEYDKRGVGASGGDFASASIDDNARDAAAAVRLLSGRFRKAAGPLPIGIAGHSEGALVAAAAARMEPGRVRFLVLICGPVVDGPEFIEEQQRMREERAGLPPARTAQDLRYLEALISILEGEPDNSRASAAIWRAYRKCYPRELGPDGGVDPVRASQAFLQILAFESPWVRSLIRSRPMPGLARFPGDIFAVWSREDEQVSAAANRARFQVRTSAGDEVIVARGLDHFLRPVGSPGGAAENIRIGERLLSWLRREAPAPPP